MIDFLLSNKALRIFSMLFGMGFAVQMLRMQATGRPFVLLYLRRMIILFLIGAANWCLVMGRGDVLHTYAIYGAILLLFSRVSARTALVWAVLFLASNVWRTPIIRGLDGAFGGAAKRQALKRQPGPPLPQRLEAAKEHGSYAQLVAVQSEQFRNFHTDAFVWTATLLPTYYFPMFFVGFAAVKSGLVQSLPERRKLLWRILWWALAVGLVSNPLPYLPYSPPFKTGPWIGRISFLLSGPSLGLFYGCAIALALQNDRWHRFLAPLRWPGRMALTNYMTHYAIVIAICYGFGFGLMKRINSLQALGLALLIFPAISLVSARWLRRFQYGPLEWIWRTLTYGRFAGVRSRGAAASASAA
ncbi:MAG: DUF418 domain-containing protein [Acidobacteria bacterium]|nr:DUF418 domain-containing protein [Acidobacteriota bacterium]